MLISELKPRSDADHNQSSTINGVVRANYSQPFPHFTLEDASGTIICKPKDSLPKPGIHIELAGTLQTITPHNCTLPITLFCENERSDAPHPNGTCELTICEFTSSLAA